MSDILREIKNYLNVIEGMRLNLADFKMEIP